MILLDLNTTDDRPIYVQIADRVKFAVASGVLRPGDLGPSVRGLSEGLGATPNTARRARGAAEAGAARAAGRGARRGRGVSPSRVSRAYRERQAEGLLEPVRGTGLQVTPGATD